MPSKYIFVTKSCIYRIYILFSWGIFFLTPQKQTNISCDPKRKKNSFPQDCYNFLKFFFNKTKTIRAD